MRKEERSKSQPTAEKALEKTVKASQGAKATQDKGKDEGIRDEGRADVTVRCADAKTEEGGSGEPA